MTARRVKVEGDLFHGQVPDGAVYVGRQSPGLAGSVFANPHLVSPKRCPVCHVEHSRGAAAIAYRRHLRDYLELVEQARRDLAGRDLACWCWPSEPCHGDVLLAVATGEEP